MCSIEPTIAGSTASMSRWKIWRAAVRSTAKMAIEMTSPTIGSARSNPSHAPTAPSDTAREVNPSVRAW